MSISLLRKLLMKEAVKDTAGSSGIMSINKNIAAKVEQQLQKYVNDAMQQGVDLDTLSPEQLKMIVQMNKPKPPRVIPADSPEGRGITEALFGKRGEIIDFPQKRNFKQQIDDMIKDGTITKGARGMKKSKKVQDREMFQDANKRLKTDVDKIIADIKAMDPMDSMKEANSVIGRKGAYKNLTPEESKKILKDTEDHIFERDIPEEDFADGGVAGLLGERPGYRSAGFISGRTKSSKKGRTDAQSQYGGTKGYQSSKNKSGRTTTTSGQGGGSGYTNTGGGGGGGPPSTNTGGGGTTTTTTGTQPSLRERIKQKQILDYLNSLEEDSALGIGPVVTGTTGKVGSSVLKNILKKAPDYLKPEGVIINKDINFFDNLLKLKGKVDYKDIPDVFKGKPKGTLDLEMTTPTNKTFGIGIDEYGNKKLQFKMPLGKQPKVGPRNFQDRFAPDIPKFNFGDMTGITSQAPANMQLAKTFNTKKDLQNLGAAKDSFFDTLTPQGKALEKFRNSAVNFKKAEQNTANTPQAALDFMQNKPGLFSDVLDNQEFIQNAIDKGFLEDESDYANQLPLGKAVDLADGGPARQNFKIGRRAFLKMLAGTGAGIAGLKSGLFATGGKEATKKAVTETVKSAGSGYPPPYFFKLVDKIKFMGDDVTQKAATQDRQVVKRYKDYEMSEDLGTGEIVIKKRNEGSFYDQDGIISDEYIVYKPGQADELTKGKKPPPEYDEYTVRPDAEGKLRDSEDGLDSIDEILEEVGDPDSLTLKKASGGIARMLGE